MRQLATLALLLLLHPMILVETSAFTVAPATPRFSSRTKTSRDTCAAYTRISERSRCTRPMLDVAASGIDMLDPQEQFTRLPTNVLEAVATSAPLPENQPAVAGFLQLPHWLGNSAADAPPQAPQQVTVEFETEVLTDVSHVVMDFSSFITPSKSVLRLCSVFGRVMILCADYLPDHTVHPEELAVQLFLLAISLKDFVMPAPPTK